MTTSPLTAEIFATSFQKCFKESCDRPGDNVESIESCFSSIYSDFGQLLYGCYGNQLAVDLVNCYMVVMVTSWLLIYREIGKEDEEDDEDYADDVDDDNLDSAPPVSTPVPASTSMSDQKIIGL